MPKKNSDAPKPKSTRKVSNDAALHSNEESERERIIKGLTETLTARLKKVGGESKNAKFTGERQELLREMKESIERKSHAIPSDEVFTREINDAITGAERYLTRILQEEEKKEKEKEEKEKHEKEHGHDTPHHAPEKPESSEEKPEPETHEQKVAARLEELRQEARGEKPITPPTPVVPVVPPSTPPSTPAAASQTPHKPETQAERVERRLEEMKAKARVTDEAAEKNIRKILPQKPAIVVPAKLQQHATEHEINKALAEKVVNTKVEKLREEARGSHKEITQAQLAAKAAAPKPTKRTPPTGLPTAPRSPRRRLQGAAPPSRRPTPTGSLISPNVLRTIRRPGIRSGGIIEDFEITSEPTEVELTITTDTTTTYGRGSEAVGNIRGDDSSGGSEGSSGESMSGGGGEGGSGGGIGGGASGGGRGGRGGSPPGNPNVKRGGFGVPNPTNPNIQRGGLGKTGNMLRNQIPGAKALDALRKGDVTSLTKEGVKELAKRGILLIFSNPVSAGIVIGILLLLVIIIAVAGSGKGDDPCKNNAPGAAPDTLTVSEDGPTTAKVGDVLTYHIKVADTQPDQEIVVIAHFDKPNSFSLTPTDITSNWTKMTVAPDGSSITWKASENLPGAAGAPPASGSATANGAAPPPGAAAPATGGNLPTTNFTIDFSVKATVDNTNLVSYAEANPTRNGGGAAGAGTTASGSAGTAPVTQTAKGEPSTEEEMNTYGHTQAEVEANLVTINFQGTNVKVHKKVQAVFEKVNNEITQANTGYKFTNVSTFNWRTKNCPSGCAGLSLHSFGVAIDINPQTNPYTSADTHDIPPAIVDIFKRNGFAWGGDFQPNHDWMHFQFEGTPGAATDTNAAPQPGGCGGTSGAPVSGDYAQPSDDNCGGKYKLTSPLGKNFGDPQCNFNKDQAYAMLLTADPANADTWFNKIMPCESGYNPNAYAGPQTGTPDAHGAWGLVQMGSATPPGSPPSVPGKNGPNDRGDVNWQLQIANATAYGKKIGDLKKYWACAR